MGALLAYAIPVPSLILTCLAPVELKAFLFCQVPLRDHMIKEICDSINGSSSSYVTTVSSLMLIILLKAERSSFILPRDITWPYDQRDAWLNKWEVLNPSINGPSMFRDLVEVEIYFYFVTWNHMTTWSKGHVTW